MTEYREKWKTLCNLGRGKMIHTHTKKKNRDENDILHAMTCRSNKMIFDDSAEFCDCLIHFFSLIWDVIENEI